MQFLIIQEQMEYPRLSACISLDILLATKYWNTTNHSYAEENIWKILIICGKLSKKIKVISKYNQ